MTIKNSLLLTIPLFALALAGCSEKAKPTLSERAESVVDKTKEVAVEAKDAVADKLVEWKLTPSDIKTDLEKTGRVVRDKTVAVGATVGGVIDNARLVTVINGKLVADKDLSARKINVDADKGVVTLMGSVASFELIGRAITLSLDTEGVTQVISLLTIEAPAVM
ncbi:MAG: BON domain-containing protein [Opitutaceae bacterium]|jgi:osmotically-inducible protein OsmY